MTGYSLLDSFGNSILKRDKIGLYLDENVNQDIVNALRARGTTVIRIEDEGMKGEKDDHLPFARATALGCVLVTQDQDFGRINQKIMALWPEAQHAGIIFISGPRSPGKLIADLEKIVQEWTPEQMYNVFLPI